MSRMNIIRGIVLFLFLFSVIFFTFSPSEVIFNSPDENANAVFAWQFAEDSMLAMPTDFDQVWNVLVHPRSTLVVSSSPSSFKEGIGVVIDSSDRIVPISFMGLSIFAGLIASIFGNWSIVLVTPMLALLAIIAWRKSIYRIFDNNRLADLAALFLMIHPAFWHYTGRTMMHNVGFVSLLIIAFYLFVNQPFREYWKNKWHLDEIFAGLSLGLALGFRSSEVLWITSIVAALLIWKYASIGYKRMLIFIISMIIMISPFLALNNALYGASWETGYTVESEILPLPKGEIAAPVIALEERRLEGVAVETGTEFAVDAEAGVIIEGVAVDQIDESLPGILGVLFPFGIHEMNILRNVWDYGFLLYPWMSGLSILGLIFVFKKKEWRPWIIAAIGLSIWLVLVYGSWKFSDNPDASILTIGNSYARYWLPLFILASIFAATAVDRISSWIERRRLPYASSFPWLIVFIVVLFSSRLVIWGVDGFVQTHQNLESFIEKKNIVLEQTPDDSIIVVDMADKYLFPGRNVMTPLRDDQVYAYIPEMVDVTDVYYFGITLPEVDIEYLETVVFINSGLVLDEIVTIGDETLYQINKNN